MKTAHDLVTAAKTRAQEIPVDQAEQAIREADVLIDVREADEYHAGHLPGAIHASRGLLEFKPAAPPRSSHATSRWLCIARPVAVQRWPHVPCRTWDICRCNRLPAGLMPGWQPVNPWSNR